MTDIYDQCVASIGEDEASSNKLLQCVVSGMQEQRDATTGNFFEYVRSYLVIHSAVLVFFMQAGFAMLAAGSVRPKNVGKSSSPIIYSRLANIARERDCVVLLVSVRRYGARCDVVSWCKQQNA